MASSSNHFRAMLRHTLLRCVVVDMVIVVLLRHVVVDLCVVMLLSTGLLELELALLEIMIRCVH
jgi:hypothetical protein